MRTGHDAVQLPLPGGWVGSAWGAGLHETVVRLAELGGAPGDVEVAR